MIKELSDVFAKYGVWGLLGFVLLTAAISIIKSDWFSNQWAKLASWFISKFIKRNRYPYSKKEINISDISNHDIFNYMDFWMHSKIPIFQFSTEYRTIIFKRYLTIFLKNYKSGLGDLVKEKEFETWDQSELWKNLLDKINKIIFDYEAEMAETGIPKIVILKMKAKNNDTITLMIDLIENICNSEFYESEKNYLKIYSILNIMLSMLEHNIANSEEVCDSINGELRGQQLYIDGRLVIEP